MLFLFLQSASLGDFQKMKPETFQILNTIGTWFAGIGTVSAVIVSLYLASRNSKVQLKICAGHRVLATPGQARLRR